MYIRINSQQELERVVEKIKMETGLSVQYPETNYDNISNVIGIYNDISGVFIFILGQNYKNFEHTTIISAHEYLTGAKETFTLSDLTDGMVIEYRDGDRRLFMQGSLIGIESYGDIEDYNENLLTDMHEGLDIVKVYTINGFRKSFKDLFSDHNLTLIFNAESHRRKFEIEAELKKLHEELYALEVGDHE